MQPVKAILVSVLALGMPVVAQTPQPVDLVLVQQLHDAKLAADAATKTYNDSLASYNSALADFNAHPLPQPYSAPAKRGRGILYGMGQAGMAHAGLPTDYEIQQSNYYQALQARQLAGEQLQLQFQNLMFAKQVADNAINN